MINAPPFARWAFDVEVEVPLTVTERRQIRTIVDYLKPASPSWT